MDVLIRGIVPHAAKRADVNWRAAINCQQRGHVQSNQFLRWHPNKVCQRPVYAQDASRFVVSHDEIANGVEDFDPVPVRLFHVSEKTGILQCNRSVTGNSLQKLLVIRRKWLSAIPKAKYSNHFSCSAEQTHQGALAPFQIQS